MYIILYNYYYNNNFKIIKSKVEAQRVGEGSTIYYNGVGECCK